MDSFIPVNQPLLSGNEKKYLLECIESGWISSEGPYVQEFEKKFSERVGRKYGVAVSNGTGAIDIAIQALDIKEGDEVIVPTFTIISCVNQIVRNKAIPVFVDCDEFTWNMRVDQIEAKVTSKTKAIMAVHIYGIPVDMNPLIQVAQKYGLKVIEDAAEAHGQSYYGVPCGGFGDISTFSFYPNKHVTTGEGGMVLTNNLSIAEKCKSLRNLCFQSGRRFVHEEIGWNLRMTNMQAAIGLAQLEQLDTFIARKQSLGEQYTKILGDVGSIQLPVRKTDYADNHYWIYGVILKDSVGIDADSAMKKLGEMGVGTRPFFWPMHEQPVLKRLLPPMNESYPVAEKIARKGFYLPSGITTTEQQIDRVCMALKKIIQ